MKKRKIKIDFAFFPKEILEIYRACVISLKTQSHSPLVTTALQIGTDQWPIIATARHNSDRHSL